jgi:hypothetical protein
MGLGDIKVDLGENIYLGDLITMVSSPIILNSIFE